MVFMYYLILLIIYKTTNLINGKIYIGQDQKNNPNYYGSGIYFKRALYKYGKDNFQKEILEYCTNIDDLNDAEIFWIAYHDSTNKEVGYNLCKGGTGTVGFKHSNQTKQNISNVKKKYYKDHDPWNKGIPHSKKTKQKISNANKGQIPWNTGKNWSDEIKEKISKSNIGKKHTNKSKQKMSDTRKGRQHSKKWNNNISLSLKGRIFSDEHCINLSKSHLGHHPSIQTKQRMCESRKGKTPNLKNILKDDLYKLYIIKKKSIKTIAKNYNCCMRTIYNKLKKYNISKN